MRSNSPAVIHLVGAGPGDPELLTLKAVRLLHEAEVVVYDRLVGTAIIEMVPKGTSRIFVGKAPDRHHVVQDEINSLLVRLAWTGRKVVRLKGGDPFIFGRGGEEADFLRARGVPVEVVPGITAASGCAAAIGVPLTHRDFAAGVRFVTGHRRAGQALDLDWRSLADPDTTLVVYMGLGAFAEIAERLMQAGRGADTPAAAVAAGSTPDQASCFGTLGDLAARIAASGLRSPVLFIIGGVVSMAERWQGEAVPGDAPRSSHG